MDRTNGAGHVDNRFVAEDLATNRPPTEITAEWLNGIQEELIYILTAAGIAPNAASNTQLLAALTIMFAKKTGATGLIRSMTSVGGGAVRELADVAAATVGAIEYGIVYNCNVDLATGVWAGRDANGPCFLEKWNDAGTSKELWYAAYAPAGVVPAWVLSNKFGAAEGNSLISGNTTLGNSLTDSHTVNGKTTINSNGLVRVMTPAGGGRVREYAEVLNAATVGPIEYGLAYNCSVDYLTGAWSGRDAAGPCWLEKWNDAGNSKEMWFAAGAAAGVAPVWVLSNAFGAAAGNSQISGNVTLGNAAADRHLVKGAMRFSNGSTEEFGPHQTKARFARYQITTLDVEETKYWKLATLPASSGGTGDQLDIRLTVSGNNADTCDVIHINMGQRGVFSAKTIERWAKGAISRAVHCYILAYINADGSTDVYLVTDTGFYLGATVELLAGGFAGTAALIDAESVVGSVVAPSGGTVAYDGSTEYLNAALVTDSTGKKTVNGGLVSKSGGVGYVTGAGGTVTQATSKATAVTLNKVSGQITMNAAALAAGTSVAFSLNNSLVTTADTLTVGVTGGAAAIANYKADWLGSSAGVAWFRLTNLSVGALSEAVVLQFNVHKGATA